MAENVQNWPTLSDRLMGIGQRSRDSGYKTNKFSLQKEPRRMYMRIQNENNAVLFLKFGTAAKTTPPSATDYDIALKAATSANAGDGGYFESWNNFEYVEAFSSTTYKAAILEIVC